MIHKNKKAGHGKILDTWTPPNDSGDPIGCVATTFTFQSDFFEEECLSRFLKLETDANSDGPLHIIEREEKLSSVMCASVLVDQHNCRGPRSLRWDLLSARVPKGILHAKVSLLCWQNIIRIIIASSNLTEQGYRLNQEVFGVLDVRNNGYIDKAILKDVISFLRSSVLYSVSQRADYSPAIIRWNSLLDRAEEISRLWHTNTTKGLKISTVFTGPDRPSFFATLKKLWPGSSPPGYAHVISPFFDPPEAINKPALEMWKMLRQRGEAEVSFVVTAEEVEGENSLFIHAPKSLLQSKPQGRTSVNVLFDRIFEDKKEEDGKIHHRPLHMKCIWLENTTWACYMIGSSNFTSAGLGVSSSPNIEANLLYTVKSKKYPKVYKAFNACYPVVEEINEDIPLKWSPVKDDGQDSPSDIILLPSCFGAAVYSCDEKKNAYIEFAMPSEPPKGWAICNPTDNSVVLGESTLIAVKKPPGTFKVSWKHEELPSGFDVHWTGSGGSAWLPLQIESSSSLLPPEQLRELPLDILILVLTSARPLHQVLRRWVKRMSSGKHESKDVVLDPHKRVDTSTFLLQRTRRISWALDALRKRLERPCTTKESLMWRLYGPVGVMALSKAITKESQSKAERCFLLAELCLEINRMQPKESPGCLPKSVVRDEIKKVIKEIQQYIEIDKIKDIPHFHEYIDSAFREVRT